jgi:hypothetical protein
MNTIYAVMSADLSTYACVGVSGLFLSPHPDVTSYVGSPDADLSLYSEARREALRVLNFLKAQTELALIEFKSKRVLFDHYDFMNILEEYNKDLKVFDDAIAIVETVELVLVEITKIIIRDI